MGRDGLVGSWYRMSGGNVSALALIGSDLYAGGLFTTAGGVTVNRIAKWDGTAWSALGSGMNANVNALAVSGTDLYAGAFSPRRAAVTVNRIAKWDGTEWLPLGSGTSSTVNALAVSERPFMPAVLLALPAVGWPRISPNGMGHCGRGWVQICIAR